VHRSFRDHPEAHVFGVDEDMCEICALVERSNRRRAARDADWDRTHPAPPDEGGLPAALKYAGARQPADGRHVYLRRMTPEQAAARTRETRKEG